MRTSLERELSDYEGLKVRFDVSAAESCAAGWANVACLEQPSQDYDVKNNCERMFQGLVEPGGACVDSDECRTEGAQGAQCSNGACRLDPAPPNGGVQGEPCGSTCKNAGAGDRACEPAYAAYADPAADSTLPACFTSDGLHCAGTEGARTCQPLLAEGDSCAGSSQGCAANTFCDLDTRVCRAQTESGPCGPNGDGCTASATCNPETGQCVPTGNSTGARCQGDADCRSGYCNPFAVCQQRYSESFCAESQLD